MPLTVDQLLHRIRSSLPINRRDRINVEEELVDTFVSLLTNLDAATSYEVQCTEDLVFDESEEDVSYSPIIDEPLEINREFFTTDYMRRVVDYARTHSFDSVKHTFRRVKHQEYITRFRKYLDNLGTNREKHMLINEHCWTQFKSARECGGSVHDRDLRRWALEKARDLNLPNFKASESWVEKFKRRNKIVSRKITKFVTRRYTSDQEEIQNKSVEFLLEFGDEIAPRFNPGEIINSDQSGFKYELHGNRALSFQGERDTPCIIGSERAVSHSYTVQPMITMSGELLPFLMIVLQEPTGEFGPRVRDKIPNVPGLFVTCTKSGKVEKQTLIDWTNHCLLPTIEDKACLILDSLSTQKDSAIFQCENKEIVLKTLPAGSTSILQPLDVYFFRQWKDFYKRFTERVFLDRHDIVLHERETICLLHAVIWNQLRAPVFKPMILYAWKKAGFPVEVEVFDHPKNVLFDCEGEKCSQQCDNSAFIQCAYCKTLFCLQHFFRPLHYHC